MLVEESLPSTQPRKARVLYLDDSGDRSYPITKGGTERFVLAGLCLGPEESVLARTGITRLIGKHEVGNWGVPAAGLHLHELVHKKGDFEGWTDAQCKALSDDVWRLIRALNPVLLGTVVHKRRFHQRYPEPDDLLLYSLRATLGRFDMFLEASRSIGIVVLDTQSKSDSIAIHRGVRNWRRSGTGYSRKTPKNLNRRLTSIIDAVAIQPDENSPGLQLADWIAYTTLGRYERNRLDRFDQTRHLWRKVGDLQEPSLLPG